MSTPTDHRLRSPIFTWATIVVLTTLLGLAAYYAYRKLNHDTRANALIACDMETVVDDQGAKYFTAGELRLNNGHTQSNVKARSGTYSSAVHAQMQFGMTYSTSDLLPGEVYEVTVWRNQKDHLGRLIADASWGVYKEGTFQGSEEPGGWEQIVLRLEVPAYVDSGSVKFYVWNTEDEPAYFDDFVLRRTRPGHAQVGNYPQTDSIPCIDMQVADGGMEKLGKIREDALRRGVLAAGEGDEWVKMKFTEAGKEYAGKMRLKGDWTDHLVGDKWSFRIALDSAITWRRMTTFSVQNPRTRDFLSEWVLHKWLDQEEVLTPRYEFIELKINGVSKGIYAYEEHFEKQIAEYNSRREGPILKYDEEGLWDVQELAIAEEMPEIERHIPVYKAADIIPFGSKAIRKDTAMMRQVEIAQQLIQQYKTGQKTVWDIFDAAKVARYYAIVDVLNAQHGFIWHNQRWYYNPVISRLEPIGFDGFTETGPLVWIDRPFIGFARNVRYMAPGYRELMFERFFHDRKFLELYIGDLMKFTDPAYLDKFYQSISPELTRCERWISYEWSGYAYNRKGLFERAKMLRMLLLPLERSSVKAHMQGQTAKGYHYRVYNYHCLPVVLKGVGKKADKGIEAPFSEDKVLDAYNNEFPAEYIDVYSKEKGKVIFFQVPGIDSTFHAEILNWAEPAGLTPEQELFEGLTISTNELYQVDEASKRVTFKTGKYKTGKDILIPKGYQVRFEKGVELDLIASAKFISKSQVLMFGTEDAPILITSSDQSANGFTVLQAEGKSEFHYTVFDNLNTLHYKGWNLTGAVTLYESEIQIDRCRFVSNHCEDALNTIRCVFDFSNSYIGYTQGDGFDSDFCHGVLSNATFSHTGNDCIDFSGSNILILSVQIDHAGDKGISLGEECVATIENAIVKNCVIGLAAKDLTQVTVKHIELIDNETAFAAYQKKPEYGPATIVVEQYKALGNKQLHDLQTGSSLTLDGKRIEGSR